MKSVQICDAAGTPALFVYLGSFPYNGTQICRLRGCSKRARHFVAFRHVALHAVLLCTEHTEVAEGHCLRLAARRVDFDLPRRLGRESTDLQNFVHPTRGRFALT
jgi:hypothetical protein